MPNNPQVPITSQARWTIFVVSVLMLLYGFYALWTGTSVSTWARSVGRDTANYWIVVATCLIVPIGNFVMLWKSISNASRD
ncbi:MAG: hypothetical protein AAFU85_09805 [Planctomycetota bacterium]